jgi:kynurenine formamidase/D-alanyl-D-alanine dipeptidase
MLSTFLLLAVLAAPSPAAPPVVEGRRAPDLVEPVALDPTIKLDVRYARADNLMGRPVYPEARVFLQRPAAEALVRAHRRLREKGYGLLLFDGYRPWRVTKLFWDATPASKRVFVADPAKGSKHNRGCAVDLTMIDLKTGRPVEMPSAYDEMSDRSYVTFAGGPQEARDRRDLLIEAMQDEGFFVYPHEWWHFDYKDWLEYPVLDVAFAALGRQAAQPTILEPERVRVLDLTHPFDERTVYWPNAPSDFELQRLQFGETPAGFFYAANAFCAPEHGGTHLDAPIHFFRDRQTVEAIPVERLAGPAYVLDVRKQAAVDPDYRLTVEDVARWEASHGRIAPGAIVLLRTGWSERWPDRRRYLGDDTPGRITELHFPAYGKEAAELLVKERGAAVLGLDTASLDHGPTKDFPVHRVAAEANVPGLENLTGLEALPETGAYVVALPMKIAGGSGAPVRVIAFLP